MDLSLNPNRRCGSITRAIASGKPGYCARCAREFYTVFNPYEKKRATATPPSLPLSFNMHMDSKQKLEWNEKGPDILRNWNFHGFSTVKDPRLLKLIDGGKGIYDFEYRGYKWQAKPDALTYHEDSNTIYPVEFKSTGAAALGNHDSFCKPSPNAEKIITDWLAQMSFYVVALKAWMKSQDPPLNCNVGDGAFLYVYYIDRSDKSGIVDSDDHHKGSLKLRSFLDFKSCRLDILHPQLDKHIETVTCTGRLQHSEDCYIENTRIVVRSSTLNKSKEIMKKINLALFTVDDSKKMSYEFVIPILDILDTNVIENINYYLQEFLDKIQKESNLKNNTSMITGHNAWGTLQLGLISISESLQIEIKPKNRKRSRDDVGHDNVGHDNDGDGGGYEAPSLPSL
tara:strand:+ start:4757 stop:5950 length:1194 start_codon:yes stop_codon:yes gene_type:complete